MSEEIKDKSPNKEKAAEKRCFVMMPFSDQGDYPKGHFTKVYEQIFMPAIIKAGYMPYRVDENTISDSIINKIFEGVQNCEMALCDLSNRNPNVLYELGLRQAYNKPVVLVKDEKTENIFDVSVISTISYSSNRLYENVVEAQEKICESLKSTGEGKDTTLIQFVRAKEASYEDVKVNKDTTMNIMFQSIMKELRQFRREYIEYSGPVRIYVQFEGGIDSDKVMDVITDLRSILDVSVENISQVSREEMVFDIPRNCFYKKEKEIKKIIENRMGEIISPW